MRIDYQSARRKEAKSAPLGYRWNDDKLEVDTEGAEEFKAAWNEYLNRLKSSAKECRAPASEALEEEKEQLLRRVAEIDAILGQK